MKWEDAKYILDLFKQFESPKLMVIRTEDGREHLTKNVIPVYKTLLIYDEINKSYIDTQKIISITVS